MNDLKKSESNICCHLGDKPEKFLGAVVPPIFENSLFVYETFDELINALKNEKENYVYSRGLNPTVEIAEKKIASLENGEDCKLFSSGMGAISAAISAFIKQGDHILCVNSIYGPTVEYVEYMKKYGITHSITYKTDLESIDKAVNKNTKIIYLESPGTMTFKIVNLKKIAEYAKSKGIITIIDNTWATPIFQKPLDLGIDISVHSCTKYLGGHSDVIAGAVISSKEFINKVFYNEFLLRGASIGPFEAWLIIKGLRTLPLRMKAHQENAIKVAEYLEKHPKVKKVNYPGLTSNPGYELARKQMTGFSGLMSFELAADCIDDLKTFINKLSLFKIGVSWGGHESLIISPYRGNNEKELLANNLSPYLIRISVGLEDVDSLIDDLSQAFKQI